MRTILVTGCAGFIGSHLCEKLINDGHIVIGIDNLSLGCKKNLSSIIKHDRFIFKEGDVSLPYIFDYLAGYKKCDTIFHLAANSDISKGDPSDNIKDTFLTTYMALDNCRAHNIKEFIFASSGSIYGETNVVVKEWHGPLFPISHYAAAKLASEAFISSYSAMYNIRTWICRLPNVVGEHVTHGVLLDFINKIKKDPDILEVLGDGNQTKPYIYVKELVEAMIFIWQNANNQLNYYNISGIGRTSVREIAEMVIAEMGTNTKIKFTGGDRGWPGDCPQYNCDNSKLLAGGWIPKLTSNEAVRLAIKKIYEDLR